MCYVAIKQNKCTFKELLLDVLFFPSLIVLLMSQVEFCNCFLEALEWFEVWMRIQPKFITIWILAADTSSSIDVS